MICDTGMALLWHWHDLPWDRLLGPDDNLTPFRHDQGRADGHASDEQDGNNAGCLNDQSARLTRFSSVPNWKSRLITEPPERAVYGRTDRVGHSVTHVPSTAPASRPRRGVGAPSPFGRPLPSAAHGMGFLPKISALGAMLEATRGLPDLLKARREAMEAR